MTSAQDALAAMQRLRDLVRRHVPGGCCWLSKGDKCTCPLCDIDRLARVAAEAQGAPAVDRLPCRDDLSNLGLDSGGGHYMTREGYQSLIDGDLDWLAARAGSSEATHIALVLRESVDLYYGRK